MRSTTWVSLLSLVLVACERSPSGSGGGDGGQTTTWSGEEMATPPVQRTHEGTCQITWSSGDTDLVQTWTNGQVVAEDVAGGPDRTFEYHRATKMLGFTTWDVDENGVIDRQYAYDDYMRPLSTEDDTDLDGAFDSSTFYTYTDTSLTVEYVGADGVAVPMYAYAYDANGFLTEILQNEDWPAASPDWDSRIEYGYDDRGSMTLSRLTGLHDGVIRSDVRWTWTYDDVAGTWTFVQDMDGDGTSDHEGTYYFEDGVVRELDEVYLDDANAVMQQDVTRWGWDRDYRLVSIEFDRDGAPFWALYREFDGDQMVRYEVISMSTGDRTLQTWSPEGLYLTNEVTSPTSHRLSRWAYTEDGVVIGRLDEADDVMTGWSAEPTGSCAWINLAQRDEVP